MLPDSLLCTSGHYDSMFAARHLGAGRDALEFEAVDLALLPPCARRTGQRLS